MTKSNFTIAGTSVAAGETKKIELPVGRLYTDNLVSMPVYVKRGKRPGPTIFISAAIHGDEINGIEIIQRLINSRSLNSLRGTLIAVPMVNVYGVINHSRYLPDRRDLNRSFPGSKKGSLAARIANMFLEEIVAKCDYGIDFHTGAVHRTNLPQIRANLDDAETAAMASAFGVPVLLNSTCAMAPYGRRRPTIMCEYCYTKPVKPYAMTNSAFEPVNVAPSMLCAI